MHFVGGAPVYLALGAICLRYVYTFGWGDGGASAGTWPVQILRSDAAHRNLTSFLEATLYDGELIYQIYRSSRDERTYQQQNLDPPMIDAITKRQDLKATASPNDV